MTTSDAPGTAAETPQPFEALVPAPMAVVHHYASNLHRVAADVACALAAAHMPGTTGLAARRIVHVGAGFGADARTACLYGVREAVGVESGPEQVAFDRLIREGPEAALGEALREDAVCRALYSPPTIEAALRELLAERAQVRRLPGPPRAEVYQGDVLADGLRAALDERPAEAMVGNFMLHWLQLGGRRLAEALDVLATGLAPGGIAVFSVPYHLVVPSDPLELDRLLPATLYGTALYHRLGEALLPRLSARASRDAIRPIAVQDADAEAGSARFEHLQTVTRYFAVPPGAVVDTLRGAALYEAVMRTGLPARLVVQAVAEAVAEAVGALPAGEAEAPTGTFLRFHVFRRR